MSIKVDEQSTKVSIKSNDDQIQLKLSIQTAQKALDLFLNNQYETSKLMLEPGSKSDFYHSLGYSTVNFLQAAITMETQQIQEASNAVKNCLTICQKSRRKFTLSDNLKVRTRASQKLEFSKYTDIQCHAELCYAESLLQKAFLTFVQDENLIALIRGGLKIRECYRTYKDCWQILKVKEWKDEYVKAAFESGVRLGVGAFNLMISMLPTKVMKLLEFVGFKGNKNFGLSELSKAASILSSVRQPLATLMLLSFHSFIGVIIGQFPYEEHISESKRLLEPCLNRFKGSAIFEMFKARVDLISGKIDEAISGYELSISCQNEWKNLHDICHWELLWCYALQADWLLGMKYAEKLSQHSRWSKSLYLYQKAVFLIECYSEDSESISADMKTHIKKLFESVPQLTQRIAGKSLPVEKFAVKKSKRYFDQNEFLILPGVELIFIWNGFKIMAHQPHLVEKFYQIIEKKLNSFKNDSNNEKSPLYHDNLALILMLKGVTLEYLAKYQEAFTVLTEVVQMEKKIKEDNYIIPYSLIEIAQIFYAENKFEDTKKYIEKAKTYKSYSLESRLHFRIHAMNLLLKSKLDPDATSLNSWDVSIDNNNNSTMTPSFSFEEDGFLEEGDENERDIDCFEDCLDESQSQNTYL